MGTTEVWATEPSKKTTSSEVEAPMSRRQTPSSRSSADERGFRSGEGLEDGLGDFEAGLVDAGDDALLRAGGAGGDVQIDFEAIADHADGIMNAGLLVEDELLGQQVQDFAIGGEGDGAGAIDGGADIVFGNFAEACAEADAAAAVDAADVRVRRRRRRSVR